MSNFLYRLGRRAVRRRRLVLGLWILVLVLIGVVGSSLGGKAVDDFNVPGTESQAGRDLLASGLKSEGGAKAQVVFRTPKGTTLADPAVAKDIQSYLTSIEDQPRVTEVGAVTPSAMVPHDSPADPRIGFAFVAYDGNGGDLGVKPGERLEASAADLRAQGYQVEFGGEIQIGKQELGSSSEAIGLGVAVIVLLVAFGSVVAMGLPLATALIGLGTGLGLITVATKFLNVPTIAPTLATMIGLGVGIDYALFIVTRHREHLHRGMTVEESAGRAIATAGQAVVFAGITVVIAICGLQFVGIHSVAMMGYAIALTVLVSVVAAITLLPALLGFAGHNIDKFKLPGVSAASAGGEHTLASRWSHHVSRHPWRYLLGSGLILAILIVPFFSIRLGQTDAGNDAPGSTTRKAYDLMAQGFGPGFNGPLAIAVEKGDTNFAKALDGLSKEIAKDPEVAFVSPQPVIGADGTTGLLTVFPKSSPQDAETQQLVHRLRDDVLPQARQDTGVKRTLVTGQTAFFIDISDKITSRLPLFIGAVLVMSFVLLMMVFRSVLVPLKAALMNLLGIGAAYGVLVAVFQKGWGGQLFGVTESLPIISFLPMFMFAILFGLSMDYEVFLMSRVREEYLHTGDNTRSVSTGISHTARVITAAAIIMVSVFGSFAFGEDPTVKMFGIGLATAIFLDATLIRMVLVPSTMRLLGDRNWWLPGWLDRLLPNLDLEGEGALPAPEYEPGQGPAGGVSTDDDLDDLDDPELVPV
ncbi:MMPL family transporter [Aquihabitans sp. G128]|uniref:MMPL family transporter n=1 Tax=Aquihabitans sp. G128 TaxID=2849779 RepID=UPI001C22FF0B|nr:MMPL family transporter [Aquihabitans sp. G128]QXC60820.1 MMPL family transporter [Aquihabitans sp. G128]